MHAFSKWIWGLLSKHKAFLSRVLITNLQYFCHKLTWKASLSEILAFDADSLWSVSVWQGMLWKETRHTALNDEATWGEREKLKQDMNHLSETTDPHPLQQALLLPRCQHRGQEVVPGPGWREKILRYKYWHDYLVHLVRKTLLLSLWNAPSNKLLTYCWCLLVEWGNRYFLETGYFGISSGYAHLGGWLWRRLCS